MSDPLTLRHDLDTARTELQHLTADLAELQTLHTQQGQQLEAHKIEHPKAFAERAELEAKRSALGTMLAEQQSHVQASRSRIAQLEAQLERNTRLQKAAGQVETIASTATALDQTAQHLYQHLRDDLGCLLGLLHQLGEQRDQFRVLAGELGAPPASVLDNTASGNIQRATHWALLAELQTLGAPIEALKRGHRADGDPQGAALSLPVPIDGYWVPLEPLDKFMERPVAAVLMQAVIDAATKTPVSPAAIPHTHAFEGLEL